MSGLPVVDATEPAEYLSASHTRVAVDRLFPQVGQSFFTSRRRPLVQLVEDTSPGLHDMLFAACDPARYAQYGVTDHPSCAENLRRALADEALFDDIELALFQFF